LFLFHFFKVTLHSKKVMLEHFLIYGFLMSTNTWLEDILFSNPPLKVDSIPFWLRVGLVSRSKYFLKGICIPPPNERKTTFTHSRHCQMPSFQFGGGGGVRPHVECPGNCLSGGLLTVIRNLAGGYGGWGYLPLKSCFVFFVILQFSPISTWRHLVGALEILN
jgi:hypothetical protein